MRNRCLMALVVAAVAVPIAGCGDDSGAGGDSGDGATGTLSKDEFVKQASVACMRGGGDILTKGSAYIARHKSEGPKDIVFATMVDAVVLPILEARTEALRALQAPAGDEDKVEAILAAQENVVRKVRQRKQIESLSEVADQFRGVSRMFSDYGLTACGRE